MKVMQMSNANFTLTPALSTADGFRTLLKEFASLRSLCQSRCGHVVTRKPRDEVFRNTAVATRGDNVRDKPGRLHFGKDAVGRMVHPGVASTREWETRLGFEVLPLRARWV
jgi:hypothetical protein